MYVSIVLNHNVVMDLVAFTLFCIMFSSQWRFIQGHIQSVVFVMSTNQQSAFENKLKILSRDACMNCYRDITGFCFVFFPVNTGH